MYLRLSEFYDTFRTCSVLIVLAHIELKVPLFYGTFRNFVLQTVVCLPIVFIPKQTNCEQTQIVRKLTHKLWTSSKTQIALKLSYSYCVENHIDTKLKNLNCEKTQRVFVM